MMLRHPSSQMFTRLRLKACVRMFRELRVIHNRHAPIKLLVADSCCNGRSNVEVGIEGGGWILYVDKQVCKFWKEQTERVACALFDSSLRRHSMFFIKALSRFTGTNSVGHECYFFKPAVNVSALDKLNYFRQKFIDASR